VDFCLTFVYQYIAFKTRKTRYLRLYEKGNLEKAKYRTEHILKHHPNHIEALHLKAEIALLEFEAQLAVSTLRKAQSIDPTDSQTHLLMGQALLMLQRNKQARQAFEDALKCDPTNLFAHIGLGWAALNQGDITSAEQAYSQAIQIDCNEVEAHVGMAVIACSRNALDEATGHINQALELNSEHITAQLILQSINQVKHGECATAQSAIQDLLNNQKLSPFDWSIMDLKSRFEASKTGRSVINKHLRHARIRKAGKDSKH
jgi:cytochrome c-type biogenesis protein CcmH/NrfG